MLAQLLLAGGGALVVIGVAWPAHALLRARRRRYLKRRHYQAVLTANRPRRTT